MKKTFIAGCALLIVAVGCAHKNEAGKEARDNYSKALTDSIENVKIEIDSCSVNISLLNENINSWLNDFSAVDNSREVEGYTIRSGWENRYPLTATGILARITRSEGLELVAALRGGVFDRISVTADELTVNSGVVPNDQALNYRREGITTVMFTGVAADSVAAFIADNMLNNMTLTFKNGDRQTGSWKIPSDYAKMIGDTYELYSARKKQTELEHRQRVLQEKLKLLREHSDKNSEQRDKDK